MVFLDIQGCLDEETDAVEFDSVVRKSLEFGLKLGKAEAGLVPIS